MPPRTTPARQAAASRSRRKRGRGAVRRGRRRARSRARACAGRGGGVALTSRTAWPSGSGSSSGTSGFFGVIVGLLVRAQEQPLQPGAGLEQGVADGAGRDVQGVGDLLVRQIFEVAQTEG